MKEFIFYGLCVLLLVIFIILYVSKRVALKKYSQNYIQKNFSKIKEVKGVEQANMFLKELYVASKNKLTKAYLEYKFNFFEKKEIIDYIDLSIEEIIEEGKLKMSEDEKSKILKRLKQDLIH